MRHIIWTCWVFLVLLATAATSAERIAGSYVEGQVVVAFHDAWSRDSLEAAVRTIGAALRSVHPDVGLGVLEFTSDVGLEEALVEAQRLPGVRFAQPNYIYRIPCSGKVPAPPPDTVSARLVPNDPSFGYQWHLTAVGAQAAWDLERGDPSVVVAVVDTGVAYRNAGVYRQVEDLVGVGFVPGWDFIDDDNTPDDEHGHGTHVAGTIAQATNNGVGVAGLAHRCSIMPIRALGGDGLGNTITVARAVKWAVDNGADVVNLSLGASSGGQVESELLKEATEAGAVLVAAAGNAGTGTLDFPASSPYVLAVGAIQLDRARASYSNYGSDLDLVAPGGNISLDQNSDGASDGVLQNTFFVDQGDSPSDTGKYYYVEGTSQAAPHVSAAAALLLSAGVPSTSPVEAVRSLLMSTADDLGPAGSDDEFGAGMVRADRALAALGSITLYSVSGRVTMGGVGLQGVVVTTGLVSDTTDARGDYVLSGLAPGTYTVRPTMTGIRFLPPSRSVEVSSSDVGDVSFEATTTLAAAMGPGLRIVSVPVAPTSPYGGVSSIFGANTTALYSYNPSTGDYSAVSGQPVPGRGYFIRIPSGCTAMVEGAVPPGDLARVAMSRGYNLLGSARATTALSLTDIRFAEGDSVLTYEQAASAGAIRPYGWVWDTDVGDYVLLHPGLTGARNRVDPWSGFFLEALRPITALLPATEAVGAGATAAPEGYALTLSVGGATCWIADLDGGPSPLVAPPAPRQEASVRITPVGGDAADTVELELTPIDGRSAGPLTIEVRGVEALPRDYTALLTDRQTGRTVSLRRQSCLQLASLEGPRRLALRVIPRTLSLQLAVESVASARGVATVQYRLTAPAEVRATVMNQAGRIVSTIDAGAMEPGVHTLSWSGRSSQGSAVPAGEYRVELRAESDRAETVRATARISWQGGVR